MTPSYTLDFSQIGMQDVARVGGKNASLGQLFRELKPQGVGVLDGFATTADAYCAAWRARPESPPCDYLRPAQPRKPRRPGAKRPCRSRRDFQTALLEELSQPILEAYRRLSSRLGRESELAVRSSATAEDLPEASFAGAAETFLNIRGPEGLLRAVQQCYASLFTDRAISYRARLGYPQLKVALSVGVMPMVRSDMSTSGVIFTLDTESGFRRAVTVSGSYGLGEFVVQGVVTPDGMDSLQAHPRRGISRHHRPAAR